MILLEALQANAKRVVDEYISIVRRRACWAPEVMLSASSRMTSFCRPWGRVTFFWANPFMRLRTTSMPRSSLALSSRTASLYASPRSCRARQRMEVVLPMPGMPEIMTWGMLPSLAIIFRRSMVSVLPTISSRYTGLYFSTLARGQNGCFEDGCQKAHHGRS